ncbi:hypothetical protein V6N13_109657 [Hibiscus sabdariffa]
MRNNKVFDNTLSDAKGVVDQISALHSEFCMVHACYGDRFGRGVARDSNGLVLTGFAKRIIGTSSAPPSRDAYISGRYGLSRLEKAGQPQPLKVMQST